MCSVADPYDSLVIIPSKDGLCKVDNIIYQKLRLVLVLMLMLGTYCQ